MKTVINQVRNKYLLSLICVMVVGSAFVYFSGIKNEEIGSLTRVSQQIKLADFEILQIVDAATQLQFSGSGPTAENHVKSLLEYNEAYKTRLGELKNAIGQLSPRLRNEFFEKTDLGENIFWPHELVTKRIENLKTISEALKQDDTLSYVTINGTEVYLDLSDPYQYPALMITQPYKIVIQGVTHAQRTYLLKNLSSISSNVIHYNYLFALIGLTTIVLIGLFIFRPMEKLIKNQFNDLESANAKVLAADRAKSEFLANMSHEIRTPMNGVMGMAELLAKTELDSKQATFTNVIVKSGASLLTIINDILDFSKIDAGQMELDTAPFLLAEAVEDVATLVSSRVAEKDLELIVRVDPELPDYLVGDVGRIRQIITNLMGNAVKFTEQGYVYVNVDGKTEGEGDEQVAKLRFTVDDTGIGISEDKLSSIFEKFSQADNSATRKHEGTGLGLSIASSLVKLMDGTIEAKSVIGEGSTFYFEIELPVHGQRKKKKRVPIDVSGASILVVDDNPVNRSILIEQMNSWKFDCIAVSSGKEAIEVIRFALQQGVGIDCIVMDYHMPEMNGGDTLKVMHEIPSLPHIPVIMLTSVDETNDNKPFSSLGVQGHLTKPTRSSLLLETIMNVLRDNKADAEHEENSNTACIESVKKISQHSPSSETVSNSSTPDESFDPITTASNMSVQNMSWDPMLEDNSVVDVSTNSTKINSSENPPKTLNSVKTTLADLNDQHATENYNSESIESISEQKLENTSPSDLGNSKTQKTDIYSKDNDLKDLSTFKNKSSVVNDDISIKKSTHMLRNFKPERDNIDVLVCEDNDVNQIVFAQILKDEGYEFRIANNGREGVGLYKHLKPTLIVMDVSMPLMNGLEATTAIREMESENGLHTPIIGVTAHAIKGDMERCFEAGMDDYLPKPVSPDMLAEKLQEWMLKQRQKKAKLSSLAN